MSVNKYKPHLFIIPEDDANRQIADGFTMHGFLIDNAIQVVQELGGWSNVLTTFKKEYVRLLGGSHLAYVLMVVDFDDVDDRRKLFEHDSAPAIVEGSGGP